MGRRPAPFKFLDLKKDPDTKHFRQKKTKILPPTPRRKEPHEFGRGDLEDGLMSIAYEYEKYVKWIIRKQKATGAVENSQSVIKAVETYSKLISLATGNKKKGGRPRVRKKRVTSAGKRLAEKKKDEQELEAEQHGDKDYMDLMKE